MIDFKIIFFFWIIRWIIYICFYFHYYRNLKNDIVIKKEKFSNDFYRNLNSFQNDTFSHVILSEQNDNIVFKGNLEDLVKKGIMEKFIVGTNNNNILTWIKRKRTIFK